MQNPAFAHFRQRHEAAAPIDEPPTGSACPHDLSWVTFGVHIATVCHTFTIALGQDDGGDLGQQLF